MVTINEVLAALTELRSDLETHAWQPDEHEHDLATAMRAEGGASAHAVRVGLRAAGPEVSHGRLAPVAARCAAILDSPTRAAPWTTSWTWSCARPATSSRPWTPDRRATP